MIFSQVRNGPQDFDDLRRVGEETFETCHEAAKAMGLINGEDELRRTMEEAVMILNPRQLRTVFSSILTFGKAKDPVGLYEMFREDMMDRKFTSFHEDTPDHVRERMKAKGEAALLYHLGRLLKQHQLTTNGFLLPECREDLLGDDDRTEAEDGDPIPSFSTSVSLGNQMLGQLNAEQRVVYDTVMDAVFFPGKKRCFFLQGSGGCGKTFLYK